MAKTPTWQRKAGQNPNGGLNEAGRRSLKAAGHDIKRPQPEGGSRRDSFCARMKGMKAKLTSAETANDPDSRINKSLRAWNCADGGPVWEKDRPKGLGKPQKLTPSEKRSAKASAKAAGRPYPNLVDNMRAARADGGSARPELGAGGDALKAALKVAQNVIKSYHGSPYQFEKFKESKIGSGVGAQAYGHGIYTSDNPNVARGYRPTTSDMTIGGRPVYSVYKDIERQAHNVPITEASKYYDKLDVLEQLMHHGDALAIKDAAKNEAFSPEAYKWFQTNVEPRLKAPGGLYEVNLHADPKKFIDLYSQTALSDPLRERVASLAQHELNKANAESAYKNAMEAMQTVRRKDVFGSDLQGALDTLLGPQGSNARSAAGIPSDIKGPEAVSRYLNKEGYAGFTYPHGLDAPGPETLNRVIFDPKIMEIVRRYADGGDVRPEMGAGGDAVKAALKAADDIIRAYHASASKFEKFDNSKIGSGVGAQAYGQGHYLASSDPVARGYLGPSAQYDRMSGAMSPKEEFAFDIATNASDPTTWTIIKPLVEKYGQNISYDEAEKLAEDAIRKRGHMYEVGIHARPEHFLDWDKRLAEQSPFVQQKLTPESLKLLPGGPGGQFNGRRAWVDETGLPLGRATTASEPPSSVFQDSEIAPSIYRQLGRDNPAASTDKLRAAGIAGIKYLDPSYRHLGEGARNYVVFNPDILEIMRRYSRGGMTRHGYATDGSVEGDVSFLDTPDFEDSGSIMAKLAPSKPQKSPSEFIKQELAYGDKQLPQYDPEAGKETGLRALEMAKMAGYLTPAAPYIAVGDFAQQMLSGEPMGAAIASAFLPGGKYAKMAGAALASQASPEKAEANPAIKKLLQAGMSAAEAAKVMGSKPSKNFDIGFFKGLISQADKDAIAAPSVVTKGSDVLKRDPLLNRELSLSKANVPFAEHEYEWSPTNLLMPRVEADLEKLVKDKAIIASVLGDITPAESVVKKINGLTLERPTIREGGGDYMRGRHSLGPNPSAWASRTPTANTNYEAIIRKARDEAKEKGYESFADSPIILSHTTMGYPSLDSTHIVRHNVLSQINQLAPKMDKNTVEAFDKFMEGKLGPKWPGLLNVDQVEHFLAGSGKATSTFVQALDGVKKYAAGFPDVGAARFAAMHPKLMNADQLASGYSMARLNPTKGTMISPLHGPSRELSHGTYDQKMPSLGYIGGTKFQIPTRLMFPDWLSRQRLTDKNNNPLSMTNLQHSMMMQNAVQRATPEWLDNIMEYYRSGQAKPWGYKKGGRAILNF